MHDPVEPVERFAAALTELEAAALENVARSLEVQRRVAWMEEQVRAGRSVTQLIEDEDAPRVVELLSANMRVIETAGAEFRAAQALALRAEGMTIATIADLFGVSRQRISALLRQPSAMAHQ